MNNQLNAQPALRNGAFDAANQAANPFAQMQAGLRAQGLLSPAPKKSTPRPEAILDKLKLDLARAEMECRRETAVAEEAHTRAAGHRALARAIAAEIKKLSK